MDYKQQGKDFLSKFDLALKIERAIPQKKPFWCKEGEKHGINYFVTLSNKEGKKYSFDYWGSIADAEKIQHGVWRDTSPTAYDILACLDTYSDGESFEDFCSSYGYSDDSITASKIFQNVQKQIEGLKRILSPKAIKELNQIQ